MSIESMSLVLHHSRAKGAAKLVLLGIANHDGDGGSWPSLPTLAKYANCNERNVRVHLAQLEAVGELKRHIQEGGTLSTRPDRRPNRYDVLVRCPEGCDRTPQHRVHEVVDNSADGGSESSPRDADGGSESSERGVGIVRDGGSQATAEPSFNSSSNPRWSRPQREAFDAGRPVGCRRHGFRRQACDPCQRADVGLDRTKRGNYGGGSKAARDAIRRELDAG